VLLSNIIVERLHLRAIDDKPSYKVALRRLGKLDGKADHLELLCGQVIELKVENLDAKVF
jgi:hypothetical protein